MDNINNTTHFRWARQLLLITEAELGHRIENTEIAIIGSGETAEELISVLKGAGAIVFGKAEFDNRTFDTVILLENVDEEKLIKMLNKDAIIIDAAERAADETEYYIPKFYRKIRVISLQMD